MKDTLRIAYYLPRFPRLTETFILREMLLLREIGLDVQVFSLLPPSATSTMHKQVQDMMPYVHYSPYLFSIRLLLAQFHFLIRSPLKYFRALLHAIWQSMPDQRFLIRTLVLFPKSVYFAKQLQDMEIDHIHAHFVWLNGIAAQIASDLTGATFSLHAHAWDIFQHNIECVRRQLELANCVITVSEYHRKYLSNLCPHWQPMDIRIVHYGLDPQEFIPGHLPFENGIIHIMSVGRLEEKKGHEYLIDACKVLSAKGYSFKCSIVGSGYSREKLQTRIDDLGLREHVTLRGAMNQTEVQDLYHHSDIFVLACVVAAGGDRDGMPNVLLEAMSMQIPVITTPVTGNPELVHDSENGLLVPERNVDLLASAIEMLINDPEMRDRLGKKGRQTVLAGFDIHQTASQMASIFKDIKNTDGKDS